MSDVNTALDAAQDQLGRAIDKARVGEDRELAGRVRDNGERLVRLVLALLRMTKVHALDNHAFDHPIHDLGAVLVELIDTLGTVHIAAVEDQVYVNDVRIRIDERGEGEPGIASELKRHRVGGFSFHVAPTEPQLRIFVAALAQPPSSDQPKRALQARLAANGLDSIEVAGVYRYMVAGEEKVEHRSQREVAAQATRLLDQTCDNLVKNRLPNPLPLRRVVTEMLGSDLDPSWTPPPESSPFSAHAMRVARYALAIGQRASLADAILQDLGVAAMFHDVGYASREGAGGGHPGYAPPFERHGSAGARMVLRQRGFHEAKIRRALACLDHHRDFADPAGTPSAFGRILRIAEDFDNLTRGDGAALSPTDALSGMVMRAGTAYDPTLLRVFVNVLGCYPPGSVLELADGRVVTAISMARSPQTFARPLCRQADGTLVDLAAEGEVARVL